MVSSNNPSGCGLNHSDLGGGCGVRPGRGGCRPLLQVAGPARPSRVRRTWGDSLASRRRGALGRSVRPSAGRADGTARPDHAPGLGVRGCGCCGTRVSAATPGGAEAAWRRAGRRGSRGAGGRPAGLGAGGRRTPRGAQGGPRGKTRCQVRSGPSAGPGPVGSQLRRRPRGLGASAGPPWSVRTEARSGDLACPPSPRRVWDWTRVVGLLLGGVRGAWGRAKGWEGSGWWGCRESLGQVWDQEGG